MLSAVLHGPWRAWSSPLSCPQESPGRAGVLLGEAEHWMRRQSSAKEKMLLSLQCRHPIPPLPPVACPLL